MDGQLTPPPPEIMVEFSGLIKGNQWLISPLIRPINKALSGKVGFRQLKKTPGVLAAKLSAWPALNRPANQSYHARVVFNDPVVEDVLNMLYQNISYYIHIISY